MITYTYVFVDWNYWGAGYVAHCSKHAYGSDDKVRNDQGLSWPLGMIQEQDTHIARYHAHEGVRYVTQRATPDPRVWDPWHLKHCAQCIAIHRNSQETP